jgi:hypothetical protein
MDHGHGLDTSSPGSLDTFKSKRLSQTPLNLFHHLKITPHAKNSFGLAPFFKTPPQAWTASISRRQAWKHFIHTLRRQASPDAISKWLPLLVNIPYGTILNGLNFNTSNLGQSLSFSSLGGYGSLQPR